MIRSARKLIGFSVNAKDKKIGRVWDLLFDQGSWQVKLVAIDAQDMAKGRTVMAPFSKIKGISWENAALELDMEAKELVHGKEYHENAGSDSDIEQEAENPPDLRFEESQKDVPKEGQLTEYAGDDNFTGGGQEELSPSGTGSRSSLDPGLAPEDEDHTAHAEERPLDLNDPPEDKTLSDIDERTGRPGKEHKPECKGDESCNCDDCSGE